MTAKASRLGKDDPENNRSRRHAPTAAAQEPNGIDGAQQDRMLHLDIEHHSRRCRPHRRKSPGCHPCNGLLSCCCAGPPITASDTRATARQLHSVGPRLHSSGIDTQVAVRANEPPRQRPHAREPHEHRLSECHLPLLLPCALLTSAAAPALQAHDRPVRPAAKAECVHGAVQEGEDVRERPGGVRRRQVRSDVPWR